MINDQIKIDIRKEGDKLICKVNVPPYSRTYTQKTRIRTRNIKDYLEQEGHSLEGYELVKEGLVYNRHTPPIIESEWIYKKVVKTPPRTRKPRTTKKTK